MMKAADWLAILRYLSLVTGIGLTFVVTLLIGWYLGSLFGGAWVPVGIVAGICSGIMTVYAMLKKILPRE
jgi:energy-converting hydrogenase Eha subunit A